MRNIDEQIRDAMASGVNRDKEIEAAISATGEVAFLDMPRRDDLEQAAETRGKRLAFGPLPKFDQLTEYVYESAIGVTDKELRVRVTAAAVTNKDDNLDPIKPVDPSIDPIIKK